MKSGTLEEIRNYINDIEPLVTEEIKQIEELCIKGRDNAIDRIPIYFIKSRVKKSDSTFLKTKRKGKSYKDFTDYGGVRLLCLFERDMMSVHDYLLRSLSEKEFDLYECNFYNFDENEELYKKLCQSIEQYYPGHFMIKEDRVSGYKSIHYLVCRDGAVVIEIQLRTLIQDVWGELEHALSYKKGRVNPYIKKSFALLAKELQNIDNMLSYLNDIALRENAGREFEKYKERPGYYAEYEDELIPDIFIGHSLVKSEYEKYRKLIRNYLPTDEWANKARKVYKNINKAIEGDSGISDSKLLYWLDMENAFISFCEASYDDSFTLYNKVLGYCHDKYCVYYRLGELYFVYGRNDEALNYFDKADSILQGNDKCDHMNKLRIKMRMAYVYWTIGDEYIDVAVKQIEDAEQIYKKFSRSNECDSKMHNVLLNNLCWYALDNYIVKWRLFDKNARSKLNKYFAIAEKRFKVLKKIIDDGEDNISNLDTAAWFYYQKYLRTHDENYLIKAKEYALKMREKYGSNISYEIVGIHSEHIKEIMRMVGDVLDKNSVLHDN